MACKNCKNKNEFKEEIFGDNGETPKWIVWTTVAMIVFSLYGLFSFISDVLGVLL